MFFVEITCIIYDARICYGVTEWCTKAKVIDRYQTWHSIFWIVYTATGFHRLFAIEPRGYKALCHQLSLAFTKNHPPPPTKIEKRKIHCSRTQRKIFTLNHRVQPIAPFLLGKFVGNGHHFKNLSATLADLNVFQRYPLRHRSNC